DAARFVGMLDTLRERGKTLRELVEVGRFYFERPREYDPKAAAKLFTAAGVERLGALIERLGAVAPFASAALEALYRAQAEALGVALRRFNVARVYVSPFRRARETAEVALAGTGMPLVALDELRELSLGEWEGCTVDEVRGREGDPYRAWLLAPQDCPPPGGEPLDVVSSRVRAAMDHISALHPNGEDVLVVAHGGVISVYACALLG